MREGTSPTSASLTETVHLIEHDGGVAEFRKEARTYIEEKSFQVSLLLSQIQVFPPEIPAPFPSMTSYPATH